MFGSIRSVAGSAAAALEHVQAQRARTFSVRDWIGNGRGVLFLPYQANQIAALRTIIATWVRLAIFETMCDEGNGNTDRRLWLIVDELDALGAIDGLKDALARLRKFGGRCVLGFQSVAQVSSTYGAGEAQTLVENCANTLILRCSASEHGGTSQFASRLIGEREVVRRSTSRGRDGSGFPGGRGWRRSMNVGEQRVIEAAVLASELEQLPDFTGYLKDGVIACVAEGAPATRSAVRRDAVRWPCFISRSRPLRAGAAARRPPPPLTARASAFATSAPAHFITIASARTCCTRRFLSPRSSTCPMRAWDGRATGRACGMRRRRRSSAGTHAWRANIRSPCLSELAPDQRVTLARTFSREIADRYNVAVDLAIHAPRPEGDQRNFHAHLLATTREVTPEGMGPSTGLDYEGRGAQRAGHAAFSSGIQGASGALGGIDQ